MTNTPDSHYFAASVATWATTTPDRDLPELLTLMNKDGYTYNLYFVPTAYDAEYDIQMYAPQVTGVKWLGTFDVSKKKGARK